MIKSVFRLLFNLIFRYRKTFYDNELSKFMDKDDCIYTTDYDTNKPLLIDHIGCGWWVII